MRPVLVAAALLATGLAAPVANAQPPGFPDVDSYPAVDANEYKVIGAHPSGSGWSFSTPAGMLCQDSLIPDLGVFCRGPEASVGVSLTKLGQFGKPEVGSDDTTTYPLLSTGMKIDAGNGVVCAVIADDALACRAKKPDSWAADTPDPPDRHYGEHGFVMRPSGSWTY